MLLDFLALSNCDFDYEIFAAELSQWKSQWVEAKKTIDHVGKSSLRV